MCIKTRTQFRKCGHGLSPNRRVTAPPKVEFQACGNKSYDGSGRCWPFAVEIDLEYLGKYCHVCCWELHDRNCECTFDGTGHREWCQCRCDLDDFPVGEHEDDCPCECDTYDRDYESASHPEHDAFMEKVRQRIRRRISDITSVSEQILRRPIDSPEDDLGPGRLSTAELIELAVLQATKLEGHADLQQRREELNARLLPTSAGEDEPVELALTPTPDGTVTTGPAASLFVSFLHREGRVEY